MLIFISGGVGTYGTGKKDPLILINGIESSPYEFARIQPDDIASFSILKDASAAALFGGARSQRRGVGNN